MTNTISNSNKNYEKWKQKHIEEINSKFFYLIKKEKKIENIHIKFRVNKSINMCQTNKVRSLFSF